MRAWLEHAREAVGFVAGSTWEAYQKDVLLRRGVERSVQIVSEAANEVSKEFRAVHPEIPGRPIVSQRHILVHEYGEIADDKIWRVATVHLPELIRLVEPLIPAPPPDPEPDQTPPAAR